MRLRFVILCVAMAAASPIHAQRAPDWAALGAEAAQLLTEYIRINTTNPPGNEIEGARFLQRVLQREGIEAQLVDTAELGPGRASLYARIRGNGSKKAIMLLHHIDVVPADARFWTHPPFEGVVRDGWIYGRGAIDMKSEGIAHLLALIAIKRSGVPLTRDIVFVANADEELGSRGANVFVERHRDLLRDVEFLITEGGDNVMMNGTLQYFGVGIAEKRGFWHRITVKGSPSHGSRPTKLNPVPRLVAALNRIASYETPIHVMPGVQKYFTDIARSYTGDQRRWLADVAAAVKDPAARDWILSDPYRNAILRTTISLTVLQGSNKTNVIPAEASADLDIRLLPDQDTAATLATLKAIVADTAVKWERLIVPKAPLDNPIDTDLFRAIERAARERDPGVPITTPMMTGGTDRPSYRQLGIITYGVDPFRTEMSERQRGMHGNDERISIDNLTFGVRFIHDILRYVQ